MKFMITQFGGGWDSFAGDCCLLSYGKKMDHHTLIDLGQPDLKRNLQSLGIETNHTLENVIFTHLHQDHIGNKNQWTEAVKRCTKEIFLPSKTTLRKKLNEIKEYAEKNNHNVKISSPDGQDSQELSLYNDEDLNVTIKFIVPDPDKFKTKLTDAEVTDPEKKDRLENEKSLGCLITVQYKEKTWQMLTLGDMENHSANDRIASLITDKSLVRVIKLPHHGSTKTNAMEVIRDLIKLGYITVISSGFSIGSDCNELLTKHQLCNNRKGTFYFLGNPNLWTPLNIKTKLTYTFIDGLFEALKIKGCNFDILDQVKWDFHPDYQDLMIELPSKTLLSEYNKEKNKKKKETEARYLRAKNRAKAI